MLEIACFNIESAITAATAGADRIELCDNYAEGGTSPSAGTIRIARRQIDIPLFAMVRARGGDFVYNRNEVEVMQHDLSVYKNEGCNGVVLGFLQLDGTINKELTARFVELSYPLQVTFHRAFDRASDPWQAMEDIIDCGCHRILTSGLKPSANEAVELLRQLTNKAAGRITVMPGAGVRAHNLKEIILKTGATQVHSSALKKVECKAQYVNIAMNEILENIMVSAEEIAAMKKELTSLGVR